MRLQGAKEFTTVCNFCSCGCGMVGHVIDGKLVNLEGDPNHVVNEGSLCVKGAAAFATHDSKVFLIEGSNAAENHVMAMKWIRKAQEKGAKIIHVDPRYNRTSGIADVYARIRPGADIAFLGAIIRLVIENGWYDAEYVKLHTNALCLARDDFGIEDGLFSGYDREKHKYDTVSWGYQLGKDQKPLKAKSLDDPQCVFQKLRQHFARYTPRVAEEISGVPAKQAEEIAELFAKNRP